MKIEFAREHESCVIAAIAKANDAIVDAQRAGCIVEISTIEHVTMRYGPATLLSAVVKVNPNDIEV